MSSWKSHPSVRIRGTENEYNPKACIDSRCKQYNAAVHMHCPLCMKTEVYYDDRILKAHYSVKHVDKGIEFAGLKILRCCENCDIVGVIKGEKKFKGAHWHCYKCRNGFNRRDEAIKHYKTHFRQPYSTFQIHITQEVNSFSGYQETKEDDLDPLQDTIRDFVAKETGTSRKVQGTPMILKGSEASLYDEALEFAPELSRTGLMIENNNNNFEEQTAIMIIQDIQYDHDAIPEIINNSEENVLQQKQHLEKLVGKLQNQIINISQTKANMEMKLRGEIQYLKNKVHSQAEEIKRIHQTLAERSSDNEPRLAGACSKVQMLMESLQEQHTRLLLEHIQQVRTEAYSTTLQQLKDQMFNNNSNKEGSANKPSEHHSRSTYESDQSHFRNSLGDSLQTEVSSQGNILDPSKALEESPYEISSLLKSSKDSELLNSENISGSESQASTSYLTGGSLFRGTPSGSYSLMAENGEQMIPEQSFDINNETNSMTEFVIDRDNATCNSVDTSVDGSSLSRPYFIVSQISEKSQKRGYEEVQCERNEQTFITKECKCDPSEVRNS